MKTHRYLALAGALSLSGAPLVAQSRTLTPKQQLARDVYEQLVNINTADSVGNVTTAAEAMAARFRAAGFPAADVSVLVPPGKPTKGNLVVRYHGRPNSTLKPILLLAHIDVVAANKSDWPSDPFVMREENGFFYGRGTADDKSMASMFVANLLSMKKENYVPDRDIILALTADEESGNANGVEYLIANYKDKIDAAYALNEGGGGTLAADGTLPLYHSIQAAEKVSVHFTITAKNTGGHSSVPRPDNAIYELAEALLRISHHAFPVELNEVTKDFFAKASKVEPRGDMARAMSAIAVNPKDDASAAILSTDPKYNSMLRTTCVATRLSGGHANNALPQTASANINCRIVPTSNAGRVMNELKAAIADTGITIKTSANTERFGAAPSQIIPELLSATTDLTDLMFKGVPVIPTMSTGATDGRMLRQAGIPTYGVSGIFSVSGETNAHGQDEKLRVKSYYDGLEFLDRLVRRLTTKATL